MTPFYFGSAKRRLFGLYTPPRMANKNVRAIVLCAPWGQEYIRAHRSMRQLASMLCTAGHHVLRFDYYGTGDSAGDMVEGDLNGWEEDIETAIEEVRDTSGVARVSLAGLRLGATLAARVAVRKSKELDALVLWDPLVSGPEYLDELIRTEAEQERRSGQGLTRPPEAGGGLEVLGFPLTDALTEAIRSIELTSLVPSLPARTHLIASEPLRSHKALREELRRHAREEVLVEQVTNMAAWRQNRDLGAGAVPVHVLERIVQWLQ